MPAQNPRLHVRGLFLGYKRSQRSQDPNTSLIKIQGVEDRRDTKFYLGKRVAFLYKGKNKVKGTKSRVIWGKITRHHGNNGVVRAQFKSNLPASKMGAKVRVMLYPSRV